MQNDDSENKHLDQKPPTLFQMLKTFTKDTAEFVASGAPLVTRTDYAERLDACLSCEHIQKKHMRCGLCGCMLQLKAKMKTSTCPDKPSRWKPQQVTLNNLSDETTVKDDFND